MRNRTVKGNPTLGVGGNITDCRMQDPMSRVISFLGGGLIHHEEELSGGGGEEEICGRITTTLQDYKNFRLVCHFFYECFAHSWFLEVPLSGVHVVLSDPTTKSTTTKRCPVPWMSSLPLSTSWNKVTSGGGHLSVKKKSTRSKLWFCTQAEYFALGYFTEGEGTQGKTEAHGEVNIMPKPGVPDWDMAIIVGGANPPCHPDLRSSSPFLQWLLFESDLQNSLLQLQCSGFSQWESFVLPKIVSAALISESCPKLTTVKLSHLESLSVISTESFPPLNQLEMKELPRLQEIQGTLISCCTPLKHFTLSDLPRLTSIGSDAISNNVSLQEVTLKNLPLLESIGHSFLRNCRTLTRVQFKGRGLPKLASVGQKWMSCCAALVQIRISTLPWLRAIQEDTLKDCPSLERVALSYLPRLGRICDGFCEECPQLREVSFAALPGVSYVSPDILGNGNKKIETKKMRGVEAPKAVNDSGSGIPDPARTVVLTVAVRFDDDTDSSDSSDADDGGAEGLRQEHHHKKEKGLKCSALLVSAVKATVRAIIRKNAPQSTTPVVGRVGKGCDIDRTVLKKVPLPPPPARKGPPPPPAAKSPPPPLPPPSTSSVPFT